MSPSAVIGWAGVVVGIAGLATYFAIVVRQPKTIRMLNGAGLLLTSLALFQARMMTAIAKGPFAFATEATVVLLILSVAAQALAGWRNRQAWDGVERRKPRAWDGIDRRAGAAWDGADRRTGEDRRAGEPWEGSDRRRPEVWSGNERRKGEPWDGVDRRTTPGPPPEGKA